MRILQIVHGFPPEFIAGTEQYCEAVSRCLLRRGHVCLVLAGSERCAPEATLASVEQDGLLVTRYLRATGRPRRWTEEYDPEAEALTRRLLGSVRPDIVHLHHWHRLTNNLVALCADVGVPVVVTLHDVWTSCPRIHRIRRDGAFCAEPPPTAPCLTCAERDPWQGDDEIVSALALRREMIQAELSLAGAILVPSEAHRALLRDMLGLNLDRLTVLPHGTLPFVAPHPGMQSGPQCPERPLQIGHWGHLVHLKGTHLILEAVHQLRDPSAVQVHLFGTSLDKNYERRLLQLASGISVQFHGAYRPADLNTFDLNLAVFPSIASESYSFALDEAFRLFITVIVSDHGAPPERIGRAGLIFQREDAAALAGQIQRVLDEPELLGVMRKNIQVGNLVLMEDHVVMLEKFYQDAIQAGPAESESAAPYMKLLAHGRQQLSEREEALQEREVALRELRDRLAQAEQAQIDIQRRLAESAHAAQEQEAILQETRHSLGRLQEEHAQLQRRLLDLSQTPLYKIHAMLMKPFDLLHGVLSKGRRTVFSGRPVSMRNWRVWLRRSRSLALLQVLLSKGRDKAFSRQALSLGNWRVWLRRSAEEYTRLREVHRAGTSVADAEGLTLYDAHVRNNRIAPWLRTVLSIATRAFEHRPPFSILMPVYNVDPKWLKVAVDSIRCQIYTNWELCIADDASTRPELLQYLRSLARDRRVKVVFRSENGHISAASNAAAELATGEFIVLMDHDDVLAPNALFEIVRLLQARPDADLIYSDEDKIDLDGRHSEPFFKPDWSPEYMQTCMYTAHLGTYRRELVQEVGGFRAGFEGSQDYDLVLRIVERTTRVHHIPQVLYHWRITPESTAGGHANKSYAHEAGRRALADYLRRNQIAGAAEDGDLAGCYRMRFRIAGQPLVSIVVPTAGRTRAT
ncbi:MAG: glycosyltransferase, partial [bacterium]